MLDYIDIISAFRQGEIRDGGNSAAIAVIKAAIEIFGLEGLFDYSSAGGRHFVIFQNGVKISFSNDELNRAIAVGDFHPRMGSSEAQTKLFKDIYNYANLCFCAMIKHAMLIGAGGSSNENFDEAVAALNDNSIIQDIPTLLGLSRLSGPKTWMNITAKPGVVAWKSGHVVFASHGYYDRYGEPKPIGPLFPNRIQILQAQTIGSEKGSAYENAF